MTKIKNLMLDPNITSTRPELELSVQMPGAYIIKDGKAVPDLNDEAMRQRHGKEEKKTDVIANEVKQSNETDN